MSKENPYPIQYIEPVILKDNTIVQLRPIHPSDGDHAQDFKEKLSPESIYDRFLGYAPKMSPAIIEYMTVIDYKKHMAVIAETRIDDQKEIIGVGRIAKDGKNEAEFSIIIADAWHGNGLGSIMTDYMLCIAKDLGYQKIYSLVFTRNQRMLEILKHDGFSFYTEDQLTTKAVKEL